MYCCWGLVLASVLTEFLQVPAMPFLQPDYIPLCRSPGLKYINHTTHSRITHQLDAGTKCLVELFKSESRVTIMACECFLLNIKLHGQLSQLNWTTWLKTMVSLPASPITASVLPLLLLPALHLFWNIFDSFLTSCNTTQQDFYHFHWYSFSKQWTPLIQRHLASAQNEKWQKLIYQAKGCPVLFSLSKTTGS